MDKMPIQQILGEGSFGTVYLVNIKGKKYALKRVQVNPFRVEQALKQIQVMEKCKHPNLMQIYAHKISEQKDKIEIIMQYCEKGDLLTYYKQNKKYLPVPEILNIFRQIVKAFVSMNVKGIMHRDLKPENVLLKSDLTIKIADFGCARNINSQELSKVNDFSLDKGTPIFSSPQQLQNAPYSAKCDVWSAGCLLYFIYYGNHPFVDSNVSNILKKMKAATQQKQIELKPDCDPTIASILRSTLIFQDKERASWRQLWLSRYFLPKVDNVINFLNYLRSISNIANWLVKQYWQHRKQMKISGGKSQLFAYFTIKFQYTNALLCSRIINKSPECEYLFDSKVYRDFNPQGEQIAKIIQQNDLIPCKQYYKSIKQNLESKKQYSLIRQKQTRRQSSFCDLDNSIRSAYKILIEIFNNQNLSMSCGASSEAHTSVSTSQSLSISDNLGASSKPVEFVWLMMARWLNFDLWFSYEKRPRIQNFVVKYESGGHKNIREQILVEIEKYQYGVVE